MVGKAPSSFAMKLLLGIIVSFGLISLSLALAKKCMLPDSEKSNCGYPGIPPDYCLARGCCYDDTTPGDLIPWCYEATTDTFVDSFVLTLLAADGVSSEVVTALYADAYPGAEWLLAFKDGKLNTKRLLEIIAGDGVSINPLLANTLAGNDPVDTVLDEIAQYTGTDSSYLELFVDGNTHAVLKHLLSIMSAQNRYPALPYRVITSLATGKGFDSTELVNNYVDQLLPRGDVYYNAFYKALIAGKSKEAVQWAYLSAFKDKFPQESLYPKNTGLFLSLVRTQKSFPGKVSPTIILALARGEILPLNSNGETFEQIFGIDAKEYICAAHSPNIQTSCKALHGRYYFSSHECLDAGCCLQEATAAGETPVCYENILGSIGILLAKSVIDEEYIVDNVLGGFLLDVEEFIPWIPNNELSDEYTYYIDSGKTDRFAHHFPTSIPLKASKFRPDFKWSPHGPTAFPFPTRVPAGLLVPTEEPGRLEDPFEEEEELEPLIELTLNRFSTDCRAIPHEERFACIYNSEALAEGGQRACLEADCCYDPVWSDLSIPACFRETSYGQCYEVPPSEREDCGEPGINRTACLENPQCCFDSAVTTQDLYDEIPWCYYKKRAPVDDRNRCARSISYSDRVGCFSNDNYNYLVDQSTCESVDGCCYEKVKVPWFDRAIGKEVSPPPCYKGLEFDILPTEEESVDYVATEEICEGRDDLLPHEREDCGKTGWFECVTAGCCWDPMPGFYHIPWCYYKSEVEVAIP